MIVSLPKAEAMPIHDWTRVDAGIFHDFHQEWIPRIKGALNAGLLPPDYYALIEQVTAEAQTERYARKRSRLTVRHASGDRAVAMVEIVSPGNKASRHALRSFVDESVELLDAGIHLLIVDLFPPNSRNPQGIHAAIWSEIANDDFQLPPDQRLTLAAYSAGELKRAFIEPVAAGGTFPHMPLFLEPERYVPVPLEETYDAAFDAVPKRWQAVLEP
jgi:hypothetical protein